MRDLKNNQFKCSQDPGASLAVPGFFNFTTMIKFKASSLTLSIEPFDVVDENSSHVTVQTADGQETSLKSGPFHAWANTWEDAHFWLVSKVSIQLADARAALTQAVKRMDLVFEMMPDKR